MFSNGSTNALAVIAAYGRKNGKAYFPRGVESRALRRISESESIHDWFTRCVNEGLDGDDITQCCIEDNIGLFAEVEWFKGYLKYVNCQAIVCISGNLRDFYCDKNAADVRYHRLDLDPTQPGPLFKEDHPHIHTAPSGAPRFHFQGSMSKNLVVDFVEFLYLNYSYEQWLAWAKKTWEKVTAKNPIDDYFKAIQEGYNKGWISQKLSQYGPTIIELRKVLTDEKIKKYGNHVLPAELDQLRYF